MSESLLRNTVYLTNDEYSTLIDNGSVTLASGTAITYSENDMYIVPEVLDTTPTSGSTNAVTSDGVYKSIANHTHSYLTGFGSNQTISSTTYTGNRLLVRPYYNSNGPTAYGNILEITSSNNGGGRLAMEWSGSQSTTDGSDTNVGHLYYSSKRDCINGWTKWNRIIDSSNISSQSVKYASSSNYANSAGSATTATYATNFGSSSSNVAYDLDTNNTTDTWVPVVNNGKLQHRVIPTEYNNSFTTNLAACFSVSNGVLTITTK